MIISFGQEMNGTWYPWGSAHVTAAVFIAAWRHVVTLFRSVGVTNVTWLWDVNCDLNGQYPVAPWWPGASYVDWAGIDCYYAHHDDTFAGLFVATIAQVRRLTRGPVMIGETAMTPTANEPARIYALFAGVREYGLSGLVWFDQAQSGGPLSPGLAA